MSPLFQIGEKWLASTDTHVSVAPNVLTFTTDMATRKREANRLASWRRQALADALLVLKEDGAA
jgi:hypothetical protein